MPVGFNPLLILFLPVGVVEKGNVRQPHHEVSHTFGAELRAQSSPALHS